MQSITHTRRPHVLSIFATKTEALGTEPQRLQTKMHDKTAESLFLIHRKKIAFYLCEAVLHTSTNFLYLYLFIYLNFTTMRKIEEAMCEAVKNRKNWANGNTRVEIFNNELTVYLHGNAIYRIIDGVKYWTFAGWPTQTTKSRLRALGVNYKAGNFGIYSWYNVV